MLSTNRQWLTRDPLHSFPFHTAGVGGILLAGVEDTNRTQEPVQLTRRSVVLPLGEQTDLNFCMSIYCVTFFEILRKLVDYLKWH